MWVLGGYCRIFIEGHKVIPLVVIPTPISAPGFEGALGFGVSGLIRVQGLGV